MIEAIKKRHSIRQYLVQDIKEDQLKEILKAASLVPSANAIYPCDLVVIKNSEIINKLAKVTPWSAHIKDATVVIAVLGREEDSHDWVEDCSIVAEHIWLETVNQGLASCWTHIRGNDTAEKEIKELLRIPESIRVLCLMPIGVPGIEPEERQEIDLDESRIKYEKYK